MRKLFATTLSVITIFNIFTTSFNTTQQITLIKNSITAFAETIENGEKAISPWEYQSLLGKGMDVDWCKTSKGRENYNVQCVKHFKAAGVSHVRIRIKDKATEELFKSLDVQIKDCLDNGLIPIIAYQADEFKNEPTEENILEVVEWWSTVARRYKDISHLLSFDLLIEATDALNKQPEKLNEIYEKIVTEVRKTNTTRIIMISPRLRSDAAYLNELKIPTKHNGYVMAEWHFYASGPSKTNARKLWTTGTDEEKALINEKIQLALDWQENTGVPTWVGAWMVGNYNDGNEYSISEQMKFANYMNEQLTEAKIPFAINSDTKFYDREKNVWIEKMQSVFQSVFSQDEFIESDTSIYNKKINVGFNAKGSLSISEQCNFLLSELKNLKRENIDTNKIWIRLQGGSISQKTYPNDWSDKEIATWANIQRNFGCKYIFVVNFNDTAESQLKFYNRFIKSGIKFSFIELGNEQYLPKFALSKVDEYEEVSKRTSSMTPKKYISMCNEYINKFKSFNLPFYVQFAPKTDKNTSNTTWNNKIAEAINKGNFSSKNIHGTIHLYERSGTGSLDEKQISKIKNLVNKSIHIAITESGAVDKKGKLSVKDFTIQDVTLAKRLLGELESGDLLLNQVLYTDYKEVAGAIFHPNYKGITPKGEEVVKLFKNYW